MQIVGAAWLMTSLTSSPMLSLLKMSSGANVFEISGIQASKQLHFFIAW